MKQIFYIMYPTSIFAQQHKVINLCSIDFLNLIKINDSVLQLLS